MDAPVPEPPIQLPVRSRAAPHLRPGERPLRAFVSSVMRGDLNAARQATVDALDGVPYLTSWAFEYTPPSSVAADTTYLRHVREADFVIWLAGFEVTEPVVNEVREAISAKRRLIAITVGAEPRTQECEELLDEVRPIGVGLLGETCYEYFELGLAASGGNLAAAYTSCFAAAGAEFAYDQYLG